MMTNVYILLPVANYINNPHKMDNEKVEMRIRARGWLIARGLGDAALDVVSDLEWGRKLSSLKAEIYWESAQGAPLIEEEFTRQMESEWKTLRHHNKLELIFDDT